MFNIIDNFMKNIKKEDINNFATTKNIILSEEELNFTYDFVKRNYQDIIKNPKLFDLDRYQNHYSKENFNKIKKVYIEYFSKYQRFL